MRTKPCLLTILFFFLCTTASLAQEKYFHELRGMEDSTGVTHLFYRMYKSQNTTCTEMDGYTSGISEVSNHVYHLNTSALSDSIEFSSNTYLSPGCDLEWRNTEKYLFTDDHPDSSFIIRSISGGLYGYYYFQVKEGHQFQLNIGNPLGASYDKVTNEVILTTPFRHLVIKANTMNDFLVKKSFRYPPRDSIWSNYDYLGDLPDSLFIDFSVIGINPYKNGYYVGIKDSNIVLSSDYGHTFEVITHHFLEEWEYEYIKFEPAFFDADSSSVYLSWNGRVFLVKDEMGTWSFNEISKGYHSYHFTPDKNEAGSLYFSHNDSLLHSSDYGETASFLNTFPSQITGLYKKPDSEILYVLTREELLEVNTSTKATTSLKTLPVSNERNQAEIPNQIKLHQNYPNPFNPSTTISFQLPANSRVNLEVFDIAGRKIAALVDGEMKTAGTHQVTFDASGLASGMYFYRLQTAGQSLTQKMMLVK